MESKGLEDHGEGISFGGRDRPRGGVDINGHNSNLLLLEEARVGRLISGNVGVYPPGVSMSRKD